MGGLIFLILLVVGGFIAWACYTPPVVREIQQREQEKVNRTQNAISEAARNTLGIVMLDYSIGHYETRYYEGTKYTNFISGSNSAHGWTSKISIANSCGKTIKYVTFNTRAINAVGDPIACEVGNYVNELTATGPIPHGSTGSWNWENFVYTTDLSRLVLDSIKVDYMDGTSEVLSGNRIVWRN